MQALKSKVGETRGIKRKWEGEAKGKGRSGSNLPPTLSEVERAESGEHQDQGGFRKQAKPVRARS